MYLVCIRIAVYIGLKNVEFMCEWRIIEAYFSITRHLVDDIFDRQVSEFGQADWALTEEGVVDVDMVNEKKLLEAKKKFCIQKLLQNALSITG